MIFGARAEENANLNGRRALPIFKARRPDFAPRATFRKANIAAVFIELFKINNQASYRVRLGPFPSRDKSKIAQNKIKAKHNIDGLIMKYEK